MPQVRAPLKLTGTPLAYASPPPVLGQHTADVLRGRLGVDSTAIEDFAARGVIGVAGIDARRARGGAAPGATA